MEWPQRLFQLEEKIMQQKEEEPSSSYYTYLPSSYLTIKLNIIKEEESNNIEEDDYNADKPRHVTLIPHGKEWKNRIEPLVMEYMDDWVITNNNDDLKS